MNIHKLTLIITLSIILAIIFGCKPPEQSIIQNTEVIPSASLLYTTPFIGDETTIRDPAPATETIFQADTYVTGWLSPSEKLLRFPVTIRDGAVLSLTIGMAGDTISNSGSAVVTAEFRPAATDASGNSNYQSIYTVFEDEINPEPNNEWSWTQAEIPLTGLPYGDGEILLRASGPIAESPDVQILWGAPSIYYPRTNNYKNILLIGADTLRADSLSMYGGRAEVSPNLARFSESAALFKQCRSQSPWTLPSFASMVTGKLPSEINATLFTGVLPEDATTIGEILLPQGYATATFCTNTWLGNDQSGFEQGMEELWFKYAGDAQVVVDEVKEYITRRKDRDWFCFLHLVDPHVPYTPSEEWRNLICDPAYNGPYKDAFGDVVPWKSGDYVPAHGDIEQVRNLYLAEVASMDAALGNLFAFLDEMGLREDTLIIFAADHGEEFFEHGRFEHGHSQYDELVRTPLIVGGPGFTAGTVVDMSVGNIDIVPTILEFTGIAVPDGTTLAGYPLQRIARGEHTENRLIFGEETSRGPMRKFAVEWPYKLIMNFVDGSVQLFNIRDYPEELADIHAENGEITANLAKALVVATMPNRNAFNIWFMAKRDATPDRFTGKIEMASGIDSVQAFGLDGTDSYSIDGNILTFDVTNSVPAFGIDKHFTIFPSEGDYTLTASLLVNGGIVHDTFFPYGTQTPENSGHATVSIDDFALGADMPLGEGTLVPGMYIWGVRGFDAEQMMQEFDPETLEQLKALGYIT